MGGQNLLGAMGLATSAAIGVRGKFLARALFLFLRALLTEDRTQLVERTLEESEGGRERLLALAEVKPHVDKVTSLKGTRVWRAYMTSLTGPWHRCGIAVI